MGVYVRIKHGGFYLDIIQGRRHKWESLHMKVPTDKTEFREKLAIAERCRSNRETQLLNGEWGFKDEIGGKKTLARYLDEKLAGKSERSAFARVKKYLAEYKGGNIQIAAITPEWIDGFQKFLLKQSGLSQGSASQYAGAVRALLNEAVKDGIITASPARAVRGIQAPETNKETLTLEELRAMAAVDVSSWPETGREARAAFLFSCLCGLRLSDIKTLVWSDIVSRQVNKYNQSKLWIKKRQVKTKNFVEIPISENAWKLIEPRGLPANPVFPGLTEIKQDNNIRRYVKRLAEAAGVEWGVSFHTARRTFATLELESGADPFTVQRLMGHKKIQMTAVYAKSDRIKSGAIAALDGALERGGQEAKSV